MAAVSFPTLLLAWVLAGAAVLAGLNGMSGLSALSATLVSTRALPAPTVSWLTISGVCVGMAVGQFAVAQTMATGLVSLGPPFSRTLVLSVWLSALVGAGCWTFLAERAGIPSSVTHALVGALCGASIMATHSVRLLHWGVTELLASGHVVGVVKVFVGLVVSPLVGCGAGYAFHGPLRTGLRLLPGATVQLVRSMECVTVFIQCIGFGMNDVQSALGIVLGGLLSMGLATRAATVPLEATVGIGVATALGALLGSARIRRMMSRGLVRLQPTEALSAQVAAASAVCGASLLGAPVSTTQVTSSALVGVGGAWRPRHVRWHQVVDIVLAWTITFPCAMLVGTLVEEAIRVML